MTGALLLAPWVVQSQHAADSLRGAKRDSVRVPLTSETVIAAERLRALPIDDPRQALTLAPGVVLRGGDIGIGASPGLSIRGSPFAPSVYIDGALALFEALGSPGISLAGNGIESITVTSGVPSVTVSDARGGVVSYVTRSGGSKLEASFRAETDEPFGVGSAAGYNRFEGAVGGPLRSIPGLTWFFSAAVQGQRTLYRGLGAADQPAFVMAGLDTTVIGDSAGFKYPVLIPRFAQFSGRCGQTGSASTPLARNIQSNYGFDCQGLRRPMDWSSLLRGQGKLVYRYGAGSSVSLIGLASGFQQRSFPGQLIGDPLLYEGTHRWSRLLVANWDQRLGRVFGGGATVNANLSVGTDRQISGPLDAATETATRDPALGIEFDALNLVGLNGLPFPLTDQFIQTLRSNSGTVTPYQGRTDLIEFQPYRLNPFAMAAGWPTRGLAATVSLMSEDRLSGKWAVVWEPASRHRVMLGADGERVRLSHYVSSLLNAFALDAFLVEPRRYGLFVGDRLDLEGFTLDAGLRYDYVNSNALFPNVPGRVFSNPGFGRASNYQAALDSVFTPSQGQHWVSPRARLAYSLPPGTSLRIGYGRQLELPPLDLLLSNVNSDLVFTTTSAPFGRDVSYTRSTLWEAGVRESWGETIALDVAAYDKDHLEPYDFVMQGFNDPATPGKNVIVNALTTVAAGHAWGVDATLEWRGADVLSGSLSYSYLHRDRPSTFPAGGPSPPVGETTHSLYAVVGLRSPAAWGQDGSVARAIAQDASAWITFRLMSGLPYTRLQNQGSGVLVGGEFSDAQTIEPINSSRLPWTKALDLRLSKEILHGGARWSVFLDVRNLFNFTNTLGAYAETGTVTNDQYRIQLLSNDSASFANEAAFNGALRPDGSIDLRSCGSWSSLYGRVNCVMLQRAQARWGNGGGIYTVAEQARTLNAYFDSFFGSWRFSGYGRTARMGVSVAF